MCWVTSFRRPISSTPYSSLKILHCQPFTVGKENFERTYIEAAREILDYAGSHRSLQDLTYDQACRMMEDNKGGKCSSTAQYILAGPNLTATAPASRSAQSVNYSAPELPTHRHFTPEPSFKGTSIVPSGGLEGDGDTSNEEDQGEGSQSLKSPAPSIHSATHVSTDRPRRTKEELDELINEGRPARVEAAIERRRESHKRKRLAKKERTNMKIARALLKREGQLDDEEAEEEEEDKEAVAKKQRRKEVRKERKSAKKQAQKGNLA